MIARLPFLLLVLFLVGCNNAEQNTASDNSDTTTTVANTPELESDSDEQLGEPEQQVSDNTNEADESEQEVTEHIELTEDWEPNFDDFYEGREFMIILSSKDFEKSREYAIKAAESLNLELRVDGLHEVDGHLSFTQTECEEGGFDYPCYIARGRWDDGNYVSIEQSDAYDGFTRGYYIVVVSSGPTGEAERRDYLAFVHEHYPDAYIKKTQVYTGCIH